MADGIHANSGILRSKPTFYQFFAEITKSITQFIFKLNFMYDMERQKHCFHPYVENEKP